MPLNRYRCLPCGFTDLVLVHAADLDVSRPCCPTCHTPMDWVPDGAAHVPSLGWTLDLGHDGQVSINSIQDANRFERESLQRERDGEGAAYVIKALHLGGPRPAGSRSARRPVRSPPTGMTEGAADG
jgi:hypothetical protein